MQSWIDWNPMDRFELVLMVVSLLKLIDGKYPSVLIIDFRDL